jgi:hypothetical protein
MKSFRTNIYALSLAIISVSMAFSVGGIIDRFNFIDIVDNLLIDAVILFSLTCVICLFISAIFNRILLKNPPDLFYMIVGLESSALAFIFTYQSEIFLPAYSIIPWALAVGYWLAQYFGRTGGQPKL